RTASGDVNPVSAELLGAVERLVGLLENPVDRFSGFRQHGTDARGDRRPGLLAPGEYVPADAFGDLLEFVAVARRQHHEELVAAEAAGVVVGPDRFPDPACGLSQHLVAALVAALVVDVLEVVQ